MLRCNGVAAAVIDGELNPAIAPSGQHVPIFHSRTDSNSLIAYDFAIVRHSLLRLMLNGLVRDDHSAWCEVVEDVGAITAFAPMVGSDQNIGAGKFGSEVRALQQSLPTRLL